MDKVSSGWRIPAKPLEEQLAKAVLDHLQKRLPTDLFNQASIADIARLSGRPARGGTRHPASTLQKAIQVMQKAVVEPGKIELFLEVKRLADWLGIDEALLNVEGLRFFIPFQFRKRGVESKLIIGHQKHSGHDEVLIRNIAKGQRYYAALKQGQSFEVIATSEELSKRRILQLMDLAFLAPDIVKSTCEGQQPAGLTAKWLGKNPLPSDWEEQRRIVDRL